MGATTLTRLFNACSHATLRRGSVFIIGGDMHTLAYRTSDTTFSTDIRSRRRGGRGEENVGALHDFHFDGITLQRGKYACLLRVSEVYVCTRNTSFRFVRRDIKFIYTGVATTHARRTSRTFKKKTFFPPRSWRRFHVGDGFARIRLV